MLDQDGVAQTKKIIEDMISHFQENPNELLGKIMDASWSDVARFAKIICKLTPSNGLEFASDIINIKAGLGK